MECGGLRWTAVDCGDCGGTCEWIDSGQGDWFWQNGLARARWIGPGAKGPGGDGAGIATTFRAHAKAILVWSPLKGIGLWQNGLVQIKFFFQINPEAIVFLIGRGHCCFDWPQATHTKLLDFARHLFDPNFFVVSQMELT